MSFFQLENVRRAREAPTFVFSGIYVVARRRHPLMMLALDDRPSLTHTHHSWHYAAAAFAVLGRKRDAVDRLRATRAAGLPNYPLFRNDPHFAVLEDEPEMVAFMNELEGEWQAYRREFGARR